MWITPRTRKCGGAIHDLCRVMFNTLYPSAPNMWIIPKSVMICSVLFDVISSCYRIINTCGKCIGSITHCKAPSVRYPAHLHLPKCRIAACGRIVD